MAAIDIESLERQIQETEGKLRQLKADLALAKAAAQSPSSWPLSEEEYKRYGRQMIVPGFGIQGQLNLKKSSILIVGAGGLGCPAAAYIAGSGVGTLGLVDGDEVEVSNLHRQILHESQKVQMPKVDSAIESLKRLNPNVRYVAHREHLSAANAAGIVGDYDLVLDCTDHPTSRYLISDICVLLGKPLVSASALRTDGQLMILNNPPKSQGDSSGGPCYRCIFPKPPPADTVVSCGDGGILGPVVGVMGVLQALEAIKLLAGGMQASQPSLLLFSSNASPPFRTVRLRPRRPGCFACSDTSTLTLEALASGSLDYAFFCGVTGAVNVLAPEERITAAEYAKRRQDQHILVDVREKVQFDICKLDGSIHVPFSALQSELRKQNGDEKPSWLPVDVADDSNIYVICRMGNDSQLVTRTLKERGFANVHDIKGGFKSWKREVDPTWPDY